MKQTVSIVLVAWLFATPSPAAPKSTAGNSRATQIDSVPTIQLAQEKSRSKKKNKRSKGADSGSESEPPASETPAAPLGKTMHKAQEGGDKPYKWHAALTSQLGRKESETDGQSSGSGSYQLHFLAAYVMGASMEIGPEITYAETTTKYEDGDPSVTTAYDAGIRAAYNMGNLDKAVFLPFVYLGVAMSSMNSKQGDVEAKGSGSKFSLGLGVHYFVDSNVAFTADLAYRKGTRKMDGADKETKTTDIDFLNLGFSVFL